MIRIAVAGFTLFAAGTGATMAQSDESRSPMPQKLAVRLEPQRAVASREVPVVPANAMLDTEGRIVPMVPKRIDDEGAASLCSPSRKPRPAELRTMAEREADAVGLPRETLVAVLRAEGQLDVDPSRREGASSLPRVTPVLGNSGGVSGTNCSELVASIRRGVEQLQILRQRHPNPLHHFAAYRDGEEKFLASGGVPESVETLRFVATAMNELAGPVSELPAVPRRASVASAPREPVQPRMRERNPTSPDPRWASGFVFNLE